MLLFFYTAISLVLIWIISKRKIQISLVEVVIFAIFLRLFVTLLFLTSKSNDLDSFLIAGQKMLEQNPNYQVDYFPFVGHLGLIAIFLKDYIHPLLFLKSVFSLFDVATLIPLYFLTKKNLQSILIYAINPISIITINIHGQMDSIPLFFFLLGLLFFLKSKIISSILSLSYGIYTKQWPILFVLPLIKKSRKKLLFGGLIFFPFLLSFIHSLFFPNSLMDIFDRVKNYRGVFGAWGFSQLALFLTGYNVSLTTEQWMRRIFLIAFFVFSVFWKDKNVIKNILMVMLFFFIFTPTFGIQWLTWLVPFIIIVRPKLWRTFLVIVSIYVSFGFAWDAYRYFQEITPLWDGVINLIGFFSWILIIIIFGKNVFYKTA